MAMAPATVGISRTGAAHILQLVVRERSIRRAEVHRALLHLLDAAAAPDRLVVDADLRVHTVILNKPPRVNRVWERCSRPVQRDGLGTPGGLTPREAHHDEPTDDR